MQLYGRKLWGSMLIEPQLDWYGMAYDFVPVGDLLAAPEARAQILPLNPVGQIPILVLDSGVVMTESAAMTLHLADLAGSDDLVPGPQAAERAAFLRWLTFLVATLYPAYFYGDDPARFVADEAARPAFRAATDAHLQRMFRIVDAAAGTPWFLGEGLSALDIFVCCMTRWRPGRDWFAAEAPRLHAIALRADSHPRLLPAWQRNLAP
ncbi:MAG: glutathione S-transferase family protein [Alphaproteobacteria bacterium]